MARGTGAGCLLGGGTIEEIKGHGWGTRDLISPGARAF
jgi:hypothetical protein